MKKCKKHIKLMAAWKVGLLLLAGIFILLIGISIGQSDDESAEIAPTTLESAIYSGDMTQ